MKPQPAALEALIKADVSPHQTAASSTLGVPGGVLLQHNGKNKRQTAVFTRWRALVLAVLVQY
jgi:hypothetical protein